MAGMIPARSVVALMERFGVPGVSIGVVDGDTIDIQGFGVTSLSNPLPVDDETLFQIGSITKTFTATAAMRLVEAGKLHLDKPVRTYLPDLRMADEAVARDVTMRHLLSHTGGWAGDRFGSIGRGDDALARMVATLDRLEQLTPLGAVYAYNNAGFYIAGRIIEVITGKPFESAVHELVLAPLGLKHCFFFADEVMTRRFVVGHDRSGAVLSPWSIGRPSAPVGGLITTAHDLLSYVRIQWEPDGFLTDASLAEMRRPLADTGGIPGDAVGLGWHRFERDGRVFLQHAGGTNGQVSQLVVAPDDRFALAILTNHENGSAVTRGVVAEVLREQFAVEEPQRNQLDRTADDLREYEGTYESRMQVITLTSSNGGLILESVWKGGFPEPDSPPRSSPPATRLGFTSTDAVVALDPPLEGARGEFLRGTDGEIAWFRYSSRLHRPKIVAQ
jgi:CubicO group peptidase (beta-lactamase class C family)